MAEVLLYHHALGLTEGLRIFAGELRSAGHDVLVPDLYDGAVFDTIDAGVAHAEELGFEKVLDDGIEFAEGLARGLVYAGFSLGAMVAHKLAQTRTGARGALLYDHGDVPIETFGESWPQGVDLQIHVGEDDPFYEPVVVEGFVEQAGRVAEAELLLYPGAGHLFVDSTGPAYDPGAAESLLERTLVFLDRVG